MRAAGWSRPVRDYREVRAAAELLLIEVALASGQIEIVTMAETFQDSERLAVPS
jgi:hypothetical protein